MVHVTVPWIMEVLTKNNIPACSNKNTCINAVSLLENGKQRYMKPQVQEKKEKKDFFFFFFFNDDTYNSGKLKNRSA